MSNQQKNQHFKITFNVFENSVTMEVQHKKQNTGAFSENHPEHRQNILQWQDQIDLLNTLKPYNITHTITESSNEGEYIRNMALKLPNLI
jgi:hypothetical protein